MAGSPFLSAQNASKLRGSHALACLSDLSLWQPAELRATPWLLHAPFAFWLIEAAKPRALVEIGPPGAGALPYFRAASRHLGLACASHAVDTEASAEAADAWPEGSLDLLSIVVQDGFEKAVGQDGFEEARACLRHWRRKLSPGAVVLVHGLNRPRSAEGLRRFWRELGPTALAFEFPHGEGLGVLAPGASLPPLLCPLFDAAHDERARIRALYARLGEALAQQCRLKTAEQLLDAALLEQQRLHEALATARAQNDRLREDWSASLLAKQAAQTRASRIEESTIWRLTRPLRRALEYAPRLRRLLRRGLAPAPARYLAFQPSRAVPGEPATADRNGSYRLARHPPGHVYVPPSPPDDLAQTLQSLAPRAMFSIILPVPDGSDPALEQSLESVRSQWYPDWELILCPAGETAALPARLGPAADPRIKLSPGIPDGSFTQAANVALGIAAGSHVVFLAAGDELTADCLFELACAIARDAPDLIYSDEDRIDPKGRFTQPFYKPDWSPDTLMSLMYTANICCLRRDLVQQAGSLRAEFEGAALWDLLLRITETSSKIAHIPKILYHQRVGPASDALEPTPSAADAARRAREAALRRRGWNGALEPVPEAKGHFRPRYAPRGSPSVAIIIPSRDNGAVLRRCLDSLMRVSRWAHFTVLVIDNGSVDPATLQILHDLAARERVRVLRHDAPFNWSELNNLGARETQGELLLFLNDDTELLTPDGLQRMAGYAQLPHIGAVGAKLLYPGAAQIQHAGILNLARGPGHAFLKDKADSPGYFMRNLLDYDWAAVTGACLMIERRKFLAAGGFDEAFPVAFNDVDLSFRLLRQGKFNVVCQAARWLHHESMSRGRDWDDPEKYTRQVAEIQNLYLRHPEMLAHDPFYNPNLAQDSLRFEPAA